MRSFPLLAALAATACHSTAPYTIPSAAINTAIAVGAAAQQRAAGGCYAACPPGTVCSPATGYCEKVADVCVGREAEGPACVRARADLSASAPAQTASPGGTGASIGVSPATGTAPTLPPTKAAPDRP